MTYRSCEHEPLPDGSIIIKKVDGRWPDTALALVAEVIYGPVRNGPDSLVARNILDALAKGADPTP